MQEDLCIAAHRRQVRMGALHRNVGCWHQQHMTAWRPPHGMGNGLDSQGWGWELTDKLLVILPWLTTETSLPQLVFLRHLYWWLIRGSLFFFSNLESHPNTQALSNYHTYLAPKQIKVLAQHFSDPKLCRLWVITSKPVLQMFVLLSQACQQESWGGGWAWCPGKAAESDWESAGVAELFSSSCCTQPFCKGRARACLYFSSCCPSEHYSARKCACGIEAHAFQELHLTLPSSSLSMAYTAADPKAGARRKTVVEIQGKKEAREALTAFMSPPKVGMGVHELGEAHICISLAHSSLEWEWEDLSPQT